MCHPVPSGVQVNKSSVESETAVRVRVSGYWRIPGNKAWAEHESEEDKQHNGVGETATQRGLLGERERERERGCMATAVHKTMRRERARGSEREREMQRLKDGEERGEREREGERERVQNRH